MSAIRSIHIEFNGEPLSVSVEVEPRSLFTKSHAGLFTRYGSRNIRRGVKGMSFEKGISADDILLEVRSQLLSLSTIEQCVLE